MEYAREPNWKFSDRAPGKPISSRLVRKERLELSRVTPLEPKSSASTSSATFAPRYYEVTRLRAAQQSLPSPLPGEGGRGVRGDWPHAAQRFPFDTRGGVQSLGNLRHPHDSTKEKWWAV